MKKMYDEKLGKEVLVPDHFTFADLAKARTKSAGQVHVETATDERMEQTARIPKRRGRPMIGDRPLTKAEKMARWRAKKKE